MDAHEHALLRHAPAEGRAGQQPGGVCVVEHLVKRRRAPLYRPFALGVAPAKPCTTTNGRRYAKSRRTCIERDGGAQAISQFAGIGYSPRVVALADSCCGRSSSASRRRWNLPSARSRNQARGACAHREWLLFSTRMVCGRTPLGRSRVQPPAWNKGVPIVVNRVRPGWKGSGRGATLMQPGVWEQGRRAVGPAALGSAGGDAGREGGGTAAADLVLRRRRQSRR